jgi:DNA-binding transcriptional regulator YdaS (Cro superfamily)
MKKRPPTALIRYVKTHNPRSQAAVKLGISPNFLTQIVNGYCGVPAARAVHWAAIIGCRVGDLRPDMEPRGRAA